MTELFVVDQHLVTGRAKPPDKTLVAFPSSASRWQYVPFDEIALRAGTSGVGGLALLDTGEGRE